MHNFQAHEVGSLCAVSSSSFEPGVLASVGDVDRELRIWDLRAGIAPQIKTVASEDEVLSVDWAFRQERLLATAGRDRTVYVWD